MVDPEEATFLSTGISMENLCWAKETYEELWAITFTTAGATAFTIGAKEIHRSSSSRKLSLFIRRSSAE